MKRFLTILSVLTMIFSFQQLPAQSLRRMVSKKVFKEPVEIKSEKDSMTVIEIDDPTQASSAHFTDAAVMKALGLTDNVPYEAVYSFDAYIQMEISNYKKNGNLDDQEMYENYLNKTKADYAMVFKDGNDQSTIIFDTKNSAMLILTDSDGNKTGFATSLDPEALAERAKEYEEKKGEEVSYLDAYNIKKTGKSKDILGYKCDEYLMEDESSEIHMWASEKLGKEMRKEWLNNTQTFGAMFMHAYALNGMVLEHDMMDRENGKKTIMLVTKIDLNYNHSLATGGYAVMSLRQKTEEEKAE